MTQLLTLWHNYWLYDTIIDLAICVLQLGVAKDGKLLHQLELEDSQAITVRLVTPSSTSNKEVLCVLGLH